MGASVCSIFGKFWTFSWLKPRNNGAILIDDGAQLKVWQEAPLLVAKLHTHARRLFLSSRPFADTRVARPHRLPRLFFLQQKSDIKLSFCEVLSQHAAILTH